MPVPSNTTDATAIDITSLPYDTTQDVNDGGTTYTVWYKYTPSVSRTISVWGFGALGVYQPRLTIYNENDLSGHPVAINIPGYLYVEAGTTYYFRFVSHTGNVSPAILTLSVTAFTNSAFPTGSIVVNDEAYDGVIPHPGVVVDRNTGEVLGYVPGLPGGEFGDVLGDGTFAFEDVSGAVSNIVRVGIYSPSMTPVITVEPPPPSGFWEHVYIGSDDDETFYLGWSGDDPSYQTLSKTGTLGTRVDLDGVTLNGLAVGPDNILYYTSMQMIGGTTRVKRWDLATDTPLSDLTSPVASYEAKDILVMADGTVVVLYTNGNQSQARSYNASGTLLQTFSHTATSYSNVRIARGENSDTFWFWAKRPPGHPDIGEGIFLEYDPVTGSTVSSFTYDNASSRGTLLADPSADPPRFGIPESCPLLITRAALTAMPEPGALIDHSEPCPCPCDCATDGTGPTGATGDPLPPIDDTWEPDCTGGGTVHTAPEIIDDEDWTDTTPPKSPDAWLQIQTAPYPSGDTPILRWGLQPLSDVDRFVEGRVKEFGDIERGSSDKDGHYPPARARIVVNDDDAAVRVRLGDPEDKYLLHNEVSIPLLSYAGRKANLDPLPLLQGHVVDVQPGLDRQAVVEVQDIVGAHFGLLDPEQKIGLLIGDEHPNAPEGTVGKKIYNIIYGEHSDIGSTNEAGDAADIGMIPCVDCGDENLEDPGGPIVKVSPPQNLTANYVGSDTGDNTYYYAIVGLTNFGNTQRSNIVSVDDLPDSLDKDNYVELNWDPPAIGAEFIIAYWVLGRTAAIPNKRLDTMNNGGTFVDPETTYSDGKQGSRTDFDREKAVNFNNIATAPASNDVWTWFAVALGVVDVLAIYGSDLSEGETPTRTRLTIGDGDIQTPEVRVVGGITQTGFYARGPRVQHHREGQITFAANVCGYKGINDLLINQAFLILQSFLNEFVEKNDGEGYRTGDFGPIETFTNGTPKLWTSKFQDAQDVTAAWLNNALGYVGSLAVCEPTALSEILRNFFITFGGHLTSDHHGRVYPYLVDMDENGEGAPLFKERRELSRLVSHDIAWKELENRITYDYHYNYDTNGYRSIGHLVEDTASIAAHGGDRRGVFQTEVKACRFGNDAATMADRWNRHLVLYANAPRYVTWATNLERVQLPNGSPVRFTHRKEGLGVVGELESVGVLVQTLTRVQPYELVHKVRVTLRNLADIEGGDNTVIESQLVADFTGEPLVSEDGTLPLVMDGV